jgi:hypothetical protein
MEVLYLKSQGIKKFIVCAKYRKQHQLGESYILKEYFEKSPHSSIADAIPKV